jgi:hypothetical protein
MHPPMTRTGTATGGPRRARRWRPRAGRRRAAPTWPCGARRRGRRPATCRPPPPRSCRRPPPPGWRRARRPTTRRSCSSSSTRPRRRRSPRQSGSLERRAHRHRLLVAGAEAEHLDEELVQPRALLHPSPVVCGGGQSRRHGARPEFLRLLLLLGWSVAVREAFSGAFSISWVYILCVWRVFLYSQVLSLATRLTVVFLRDRLCCVLG